MQTKRVIKLCNNKDVPKRGDTNYDPDYKFDLIYKAIVNNVNATKNGITWRNQATRLHGDIVDLVEKKVA